MTQSPLLEAFLNPIHHNGDTSKPKVMPSDIQNKMYKNAVNNAYKVILLTLQNAINSSSHGKSAHSSNSRNSKTVLPFLFNQTIKKLDEYIGTENNFEYMLIVSLF